MIWLCIYRQINTVTTELLPILAYEKGHLFQKYFLLVLFSPVQKLELLLFLKLVIFVNRVMNQQVPSKPAHRIKHKSIGPRYQTRRYGIFATELTVSFFNGSHRQADWSAKIFQTYYTFSYFIKSKRVTQICREVGAPNLIWSVLPALRFGLSWTQLNWNKLISSSNELFNFSLTCTAFCSLWLSRKQAFLK